MSELRQRPVQQPPSPSKEQEPERDSNEAEKDRKQQQKQPTRRVNYDDDDGRLISLLDIIRVLVTLVLASCGMSYYMTSGESLIWGYRPWFTRWPLVVQYFRGPVNLTPEQLSLYNGTDPSLPIYLAINGTIFDVSANRAMYGPGGGYNFFTGRDATRAFVTGCFREDLTPDLDGVEEMFIPVDDEDDEEERAMSSRDRKLRREREVREAKAKVRETVKHWEEFFRNHKKYFEVGKVIVNNTNTASASGIKDAEPRTKPKRELCEAARKNRPKRKDLKKEKSEKRGKYHK
ncbi:hypothetical protein VTN77DRAFT_7695 [Rasamsonia byssochlamydoides]|uniref:uncharacterized protein n=1 Tax=Rasamsonia byssochlamydoides TaxID=89139 RepID=UPI003741F74C